MTRKCLVWRFSTILLGITILIGLVPPTAAQDNTTSTPEGNAVEWQTDTVTLSASDFRIVANGETFTANAWFVDVGGDPGGATYTTLELEWSEHSVPMRLYIYFEADGDTWQAFEIRTYDGSKEGEWVSYEDTFFTSPLGEAYQTADFALETGDYGLYFSDLQLQAFTSVEAEESTTGTPEGNAVKWKTKTVTLSASNFYIRANGEIFTSFMSNIAITSDPGDETYTTLEVEWKEHDVPMRLYIYFEADGDTWQAFEIRTYDGSQEGDWLYYEGTFFTSPLGQAYQTADFALEDGSYGLYFSDLQIQAFKNVDPTVDSTAQADVEATTEAEITATETADSAILFHDTFDDNHNNWETANQEDAFSEIVDGKFIIYYDYDERSWTVMPGWQDFSLAPQFTEPYEAEIQFRILKMGGGNPGVGLSYNIEADYKDYARFGVRLDGAWFNYKKREGAAVTGTSSLGINFNDGLLHTLRLRVLPDTVTLYVDDVEVTQAPNFDAGIFGTAGFLTYGKVRVEFDDFIIRPLETEATESPTAEAETAPIPPTSAIPQECHNVAVSIRDYSSAFNDNYLPDNLLDDDPATGWSSAFSSKPQFVTINLDGVQTVYGILLDSYSPSPGYKTDSIKDFAIRTENTDGKQLLVFEGQAAYEQGYQSYTFAPVETDHLTLDFYSTYGGDYFEAADILVCALPKPNA